MSRVRVGDTVDVLGCRVLDVQTTAGGTRYLVVELPLLPTGRVTRAYVAAAGVVLSREQVVRATEG